MIRLGRLPWINTAPVFSAIDNGIVPCSAAVVTATAAELNDLLAAGELDLSAISAVEYARNAKLYHLLPDLAISCDGPIHSVALFSKRPIQELRQGTILLTASSSTSVLLLKLLCRHVWKISPNFATVRAEPNDLAQLATFPHDAVLVIGDAALHLRASGVYPVFQDLGTAWKDWTGLPFVFAVWAARRDAPREEALELHQLLLRSRAWGVEHLEEIANDASKRTGMPYPTVLAYLSNIDYALSYRHLAGLNQFFGQLASDGVVPDGSLTFLTAA